MCGGLLCSILGGISTQLILLLRGLSDCRTASEAQQTRKGPRLKPLPSELHSAGSSRRLPPWVELRSFQCLGRVKGGAVEFGCWQTNLQAEFGGQVHGWQSPGSLVFTLPTRGSTG